MREKVLLKTSIYDYELPEFNKMTENNDDIILDNNTPTLQPTLSNVEIEGVNELTMPDNIDSTTPRPISVLEQHLTPNEQDTADIADIVNDQDVTKCETPVTYELETSNVGPQVYLPVIDMNTRPGSVNIDPDQPDMQDLFVS